MGSKSHIVVVGGTGTEVGKTHVAAALLAAWGESRRVVGYKPVETGVRGGPASDGEDGKQLARASTFHVKQAVFHQTFAEPVSPHLAARRRRVRIDLRRIVEQARKLAGAAEGVVVELAGGLFTPLGLGTVNADLVRNLKPARLILVVPDRLGVLHDVGAALLAARHVGVRVYGVVVSSPAEADASTGTNAAEIERAVMASVLAIFPRAAQGSAVTRRAAYQLMQALDIA
jgi:dethiobiotin synthetase